MQVCTRIGVRGRLQADRVPDDCNGSGATPACLLPARAALIQVNALSRQPAIELRRFAQPLTFFTPHLAIDVLAALPFEHDIQLNGGAAGSTRQLPPTVSLQYHLQPLAKVAPFVGMGLNYTMFFNEESSLGDLRLDDSFGLALQAGVDLAFDRNWSAGIDARWIDIDTKVSLNGSNIGTAHLDPLVYGFTLVRRF